MKTQHTPGPWSFDGQFINSEQGATICQFFDKEENDFLYKESNAALIAAAPDLLHALILARMSLKELAGEVYDFGSVGQIIDQAIAKAASKSQMATPSHRHRLYTPKESKEPEKFYRICQVTDQGTIHPFETNQFGEPNNWFAEKREAEEWIKETFIDAHPGTTPNILSLVVLPVFTVTFK